jgi:hypothetical protein
MTVLDLLSLLGAWLLGTALAGIVIWIVAERLAFGRWPWGPPR